MYAAPKALPFQSQSGKWSKKRIYMQVQKDKSFKVPVCSKWAKGFMSSKMLKMLDMLMTDEVCSSKLTKALPFQSHRAKKYPD